jgi:hypothetical protein
MSRCVDKQLEHIRSSRCISLSSNWILKLSFKSSVPRSFSGDSWVSLTNEVLFSKTDALAEDLLSPAHTLLRSLKAAAVVATAFTPPALPVLTSAAAIISSEVAAASAVVADAAADILSAAAVSGSAAAVKVAVSEVAAAVLSAADDFSATVVAAAAVITPAAAVQAAVVA